MSVCAAATLSVAVASVAMASPRARVARAATSVAPQLITAAETSLVASPSGAGGVTRSIATARSSKRPAKPTHRKPSARKPKARPTGPAWSSPRGAEALSSALASALASHTRGGTWGAIVLSVTRGDTLFEQNPDAMLEPASTMKMFTSAVALERFGPDHVFRTPVLRDGPVTSDGTLQGNLYLRGVGDPSLTTRFWHSDEPMDVLAREIAAAGIKHVHGDVIGDASAFDGQLVPDGWKPKWLGLSYGAKVSALSLDENLLWVDVQPGSGGATVTLDPASAAIPIHSSVQQVRGSGGHITASRQPDGSINVRGTIGSSSRPLKYSLVADDPPLYTTGALTAALRKAGITVDGTTRLGATPSSAVQVAALASPPLSQIVGEMDRESINIFAELLFRAAAHAADPQHAGSAQTGLANLRDFLGSKVGAQPNAVDVVDGSGLSPLDHVSPRAMVDLLSYVHHAAWGPVFHASLPVEGESGTLKRRAKGTPARGNLHAKTGTTNTVAALGGYVTAKDGEVLAFSFIYNGNDRANAKAAMDQMGATLAEFVRE